MMVRVDTTRSLPWHLRFVERRRRLVASIQALRGEFGLDLQGPSGEKLAAQGHAGWRVRAALLLDQAEHASRYGSLEEGWRSATAAARCQIEGLSAPELVARARALRAEAASKLGSWRRTAAVGVLDAALGRGASPSAFAGSLAEVRRALADPEALAEEPRAARGRALGALAAIEQSAAGEARDPEVLRAAVWLATLLRDEHSSNEYAKLGYLQKQLIGLFVLLALEVAWIAWQAEPAWFRGPKDAALEVSLAFLQAVALFGALGGTFSAILSLARQPRGQRIPEHLNGLIVTCGRPLLGAAAALVLYAFTRSEFLVFGLPSPALYLVVSFAAGFSEKLIVKSVEKLAGTVDQAPPSV